MFGTAVHGSERKPAPGGDRRTALSVSVICAVVPVFGKGKSDPVLAVDIDGVISLFGFDQRAEPGQVDATPCRGSFSSTASRSIPGLNQLSNLDQLGLGERLGAAAQRATAPTRAAHLTFDGRARFGTAHWKLEALDEYAGSPGVDRRQPRSELLRVGGRAPHPNPPGPDRARRRPPVHVEARRAGSRLVFARLIASRLAGMGEDRADHLLGRDPEDPGPLRTAAIYWAVERFEDLPGDAEDHTFRRWRRASLAGRAAAARTASRAGACPARAAASALPSPNPGSRRAWRATSGASAPRPAARRRPRQPNRKRQHMGIGGLVGSTS